MSDPGTYQIPSEFLDVNRDETNLEESAHQETASVMEVKSEEALSAEAMTQEIAYLGDWVVHERTEKLQSSELAIGLNSLWRKLGGDFDTEKSLMIKEAHLSSELFADKRSNIFFFDKVGEGHGEWVINRYDEASGGFITIYYEVKIDERGQGGEVLVKWPDYPHRHATEEEIERLHTITSRYYELIKSRIYS